MQLISSVRFWGLADVIDDEIIDFYPSREAAGQAAKACLRDEPD